MTPKHRCDRHCQVLPQCCPAFLAHMESLHHAAPLPPPQQASEWIELHRLVRDAPDDEAATVVWDRGLARLAGLPDPRGSYGTREERGVAYLAAQARVPEYSRRGGAL